MASVDYHPKYQTETGQAHLKRLGLDKKDGAPSAADLDAVEGEKEIAAKTSKRKQKAS